MAYHEYRPPTALGGSVVVYLYRQDVRWLEREARAAERWVPSSFHKADIVHALIVGRRRQLGLSLRPRRNAGGHS